MRTTISSRCHRSPQLSCNRGPELQNASAHRLIGNIEPALGEQILHVATAQGEPEIQPDRVLDDWRTLSDPFLPGDPVAVTMPEREFRDGRRLLIRYKPFDGTGLILT
jgi:hypothetical protein